MLKRIRWLRDYLKARVITAPYQNGQVLVRSVVQGIRDKITHSTLEVYFVLLNLIQGGLNRVSQLRMRLLEEVLIRMERLKGFKVTQRLLFKMKRN